MKIISNASPLIFLAKIGKLDLLENYEIIIPKQVHEEIIKGKKIGRDDSYKIESLIEKNKIKVDGTKINKEIDKLNLGEGEKATISLGIKKKVNIILLDERKARRVAKFYKLKYKLKPRGTIGILLEAHKNKKISKEEIKELLQKLIKEGYRISEELIIGLLKEIK